MLKDFAFFCEELKTEACVTLCRLYSLNSGLTQDLRLDEFLERLDSFRFDARSNLMEAAAQRSLSV